MGLYSFLLTCLLRGMTLAVHYMHVFSVSFYSHASCEAWHGIKQLWNFRIQFLLTCLLRGMTTISLSSPVSCMFLLTCLLRGMTFCACKAYTRQKRFYSHASCEAWLPPDTSAPASPGFYSHASCEAWHASALWYVSFLEFLLTCLLRGMTYRKWLYVIYN